MCGIAGIIGQVTNAETRLQQMSKALVHRGPDDDGQHIWSPAERQAFAAFTHRRLAIIDLSPAAHQPMHTPDGLFTIIFNGEIYNYRSLRKELETEGVEFRSHSDTEVLLQLYARRGADCLKWLRGMFAFAVRNNESGEVFLARDPLGIKPLYYYQAAKQFVFASELRAVMASGLMPRRLSRPGLLSYLQNGSISGPVTIIDKIHLLPPGHFMRVRPREDGSISIECRNYAVDLIANGNAITGLQRDAAVEALREALKESVRVHLESDVPLGPFLSGGMDSSAIVALMSAVSKEKPSTFSVVFHEERFSEAVHARQVANTFGTIHHEILLGQDRLFEMLPAAVSAEDQPTMDGINTYVVSKAVREAGITVALSGLGGDELFGGYPTFRRAQRLQTATHFPIAVRGAVSSVGRLVWNRSRQQDKLWQLLESDGSPQMACAVSRQLLSEHELELVLGKTRDEPAQNGQGANQPFDDGDFFNAVSRYELSGYMANTLLRDTDSMSMAHSLEVRVPFIDVEIVRLVLSLPGTWKQNGGRQKPLLQDALGDLLPPEIVSRPKMGFSLPFQDWIQSRLRDQIETAFAADLEFDSIGLKAAGVRKIWTRFLQAPESVGWSRPWALYVLNRWCRRHGVIA
jgi:asparagine synthase (glutamine-hydrolysing)